MDQQISTRCGLTGAQAYAANEMLVCPSCARPTLDLFEAEAVCRHCASRFSILDGILDVGRVDPTPAFYDDPAYRKFAAGAVLHHAMHYRPESLSGKIEAWIKADLRRLMTRFQGPIVDLGCGTGSGFDEFGGANLIVGIDGNLELLQVAKRAHPEATLICAPLDRLPFRAGSVETMVANAVLEHVFNLERTIESIACCLAPNGTFYVMIPTEGGPAVSLARFVTSQRNAPIHGFTPKESRRAQHLDHCNTIFAIENALRKHFLTEKTLMWPFRLGGTAINLTKSYRLRPIRCHTRGGMSVGTAPDLQREP
jgi:SAM-dependent methyltransferase